mmetsp:Transcript_84843/g.150241  ORF Transcript_84843/g.150241 Transcript_84843/m.150241 type:complete len:90 (+) Transcript_84843:330-599(+)
MAILIAWQHTTCTDRLLIAFAEAYTVDRTRVILANADPTDTVSLASGRVARDDLAGAFRAPVTSSCIHALPIESARSLIAVAPPVVAMR